jgi:hypothetical protein
MASLFISYSRKDVEAARKLTEAFKTQDLDFWIDGEGIALRFLSAFELTCQAGQRVNTN